MKKNQITTKEITISALFIALIAITSQISIPMHTGVPFTLQTLVIPLLAVLVGAKRGAFITSIYVFMGMIGLPVFAGGSGGMTSVFGFAGGFIISFPIMAFIAGLAKKKNNVIALLLITISTLVNFIFGMIVFSLVAQVSLNAAFIAVVLPYIPTSIIKILIIWLVTIRFNKSKLTSLFEF